MPQREPPEPPDVPSAGGLDLSTHVRILAALGVGICVWRLEVPQDASSLRLLSCNPAAGIFLHVDPAEVVGRRIHEAFPGTAGMPLAAIIVQVIESGESRTIEAGEDLLGPGAGSYAIRAAAISESTCCVEFINLTERERSTQMLVQRSEQLRRTVLELWSEMDLARTIQTALLPTTRRVTGYDVATGMHPAQPVGGDYVDVFELNGSIWMLIGDVSGRGIPAGLAMMMVQTAVRSVVTALEQQGIRPLPSTVLSAVNLALVENLREVALDQYMTITAVRVDGGWVRHAGLHQDLLVHRAGTGVLDRFESEGLWLGVVTDANLGLVDQGFQLAEGDTLLLFTDGLTEGRGERGIRGQRDLEALFVELAAANTPVERMVQILLDRTTGEPPRDDCTVLVARRQEAIR